MAGIFGKKDKAGSITTFATSSSAPSGSSSRLTYTSEPQDLSACGYTYTTISSDSLNWSYAPTTTDLRYTGEDGTSVTIPLDTIATRDTVDDKIEEAMKNYNGTKPILDKLDVIVKKLDALDKKYLKNAMHDELKDLMNEINDYRKSEE